MAAKPRQQPLLTLEPLLEAVREGLERADWELSGLQKTTSYEFEGRWAGDSSRSAFLFFHREDVPSWASIDVFLDETSRGLKGNIALVMDGPALREVGDPGGVLAGLAAVARSVLPPKHRAPLTLRYRLPGLLADPGDSHTEYRVKVHLPDKALAAGHAAVGELVATLARSFLELLASPELGPYLAEEESEG
jgi:hypothetical protein